MSCHAEDVKIIGPSFKSIRERYSKSPSPQVLSVLMEGSVGKHGLRADVAGKLATWFNGGVEFPQAAAPPRPSEGGTLRTTILEVQDGVDGSQCVDSRLAPYNGITSAMLFNKCDVPIVVYPAWCADQLHGYGSRELSGKMYTWDSLTPSAAVPRIILPGKSTMVVWHVGTRRSADYIPVASVNLAVAALMAPELATKNIFTNPPNSIRYASLAHAMIDAKNKATTGGNGQPNSMSRSCMDLNLPDMWRQAKR